MNTKRMRTNSRSMPIGIIIGICSSVGITLAFAAILASLIVNERIGINSLQYYTFVITAIAALTGGVIAGKYTNEKPAISCGAAALIYGLILMFVGILFFNGDFHGVWTSLISIIIGCLLACTICLRKKVRGYTRKRHHR